MNVLIQTSQAESKDIKLFNKNSLDTKPNEEKDFFENIISDILSNTSESKNRSFLLSKLLNLSSEFEKKEQTLSDFSDEKLFTDNQIGQISIQELLKIATQIKNGEDPTFPTDSKALKLALLKSDVVEEFKSAKNIKELLDIAKKNGIEVKNFQFFKEDAALDPKDKKMVQKIKSEDIFRLIKKQLNVKADKNITVLNDPKEIIKQNEKKPTILQTILSSKEIVKPIQTKMVKPTMDIKKEIKIDSEKTVIIESKEVEKDTQKIVKTKKIDQKQISSAGPELVIQIKESKKEQPIVETQKIVKNSIETITEIKKLDQKQISSAKPELVMQIKESKKEQPIVETKKLDQKQISSTKPELAVQTKEIKKEQPTQKIVKNNIETIPETKILDQKQISSAKPELVMQTNKVKKEQPIIKSKKLDQKQITSDKPELAVQTKEIKKEQPIIKTQKEIKKIAKNSFETVLNTKRIDQKQNTIIKPESTTENRDIQIIENRETGDKTIQNIDTKTSHVEKTKDNHEFKRTFNAFAQEFKEKVENYKAPLMKIKMELKPAGLGDVDVTLLSRGNNLQVNINSNSSTIAMFIQNQVEFKNSLINMGFSDLQMNFGDGQKKGHADQNGKNSKNSFETFQEKEDTDGFEIIVPQYG